MSAHRVNIHRWVYVLIILSATFAVFGSSVKFGFVNWDDGLYIYENPIIKSFSFENAYKIFAGYQSPTWHPLTWFSHALDYRLYHLEPGGHHLTNLILHGLNTLCVFFLFLQLVRRAAPGSMTNSSLLFFAMVVALLFGLHPLRVESVVWIAERKGLLATFFGLLSLLTYLSYAAAESIKRSRKFYLASILFFLFALMSKPTMVPIPVLLLLLDIYPLRRFQRLKNRVSIFLEKIPFFFLSLMAGILELIGEYKGGTIEPFHIQDTATRLIQVVNNLTFYIQKTLWPVQLVPFYPLTRPVSFLDPSFLWSLSILLLISIFCVWMWRRKQIFWSIAWLFYLVSILPMIGIIQSGAQAAADRYTYFPTLSFYMLMGSGLAWAWNRLENAGLKKTMWRVCRGSGLLIFLFLAGLTFHQMEVWRNPMALWQHVVAKYPNRIALAHTNLGNAYSERGDLVKAEDEYKRAIGIHPEFLDAHNNLGIIYARENHFPQAEEHFRTAIRIDPDHLGAHNNLGILYSKMGQLNKAEKEFKIVLNQKPDHVAAHNNLGLIWEKKGLLKEAETEYNKALEIDPDYPSARFNLFKLFQKMESLKEPSSVKH